MRLPIALAASVAFCIASFSASSVFADETSPASRDKAAPSVSAPDKPAGRGFVLTIGSGASFLGGQAAQGVDVAGGQMTFELRMGAYFTRHVGIVAGAQGGYGFLAKGCSSHCENAVSYQFPLLVQFAPRDRQRGVYFEAGFAALPTYLASTDGKGGGSPETLSLSAPIDWKLGVGFRVPRKDSNKGAFDVRLGIDLGKFDHVESRTVNGDAVGDIAPNKMAMHFALGLSAGWHFTP